MVPHIGQIWVYSIQSTVRREPSGEGCRLQASRCCSPLKRAADLKWLTTGWRTHSFRSNFHCKWIPGRPWRLGLLQPQPARIPYLFNKTVNRQHIVVHRQSYQKWDHACRPPPHYNLQLIVSDELYRSSPTKLQLWSRVITPDQYFTDVFRCLSPSHTGLTTRLRPPCDRKMMTSWENRRKNVRVVAEVVRLVAEVVGDGQGKINGNKVDGHVQNF